MTKEQIQKLYDAMASLLDDIESMQLKSTENHDLEGCFGPFSEWEETPEGMTIDWANLAISFENLQKILKEIDNASFLQKILKEIDDASLA